MEDPVVYGNPKPSKNPIVELIEAAKQLCNSLPVDPQYSAVGNRALAAIKNAEKLVIYHIRRPLRRARGNSFYRDKSDRGQRTFCGASETLCDCAHRSLAVIWIDYNGCVHMPCLDCVSIRFAETNYHA